MRRKKILQSDITGERGVNLVQRIVLEMGFLWHPIGGVEAGIDGVVELRDDVTGEVTNSIIQVQSKATKGGFTAETSEGFTYLYSEKDLNYWIQGNAPVILIVSRPDTNEAYWVSVKDYFKDLERRKTRKIHFDKRQHRFNADCKAALMSLALPRDAGIYLAPPPKNMMKRRSYGRNGRRRRSGSCKTGRRARGTSTPRFTTRRGARRGASSAIRRSSPPVTSALVSTRRSTTLA